MRSLNITNALSDTQILEEFGFRVAANRVHQNITQLQLARTSGVSESTIQRFEVGGSVLFASVVKILQALGVLNELDSVFGKVVDSPMQLLKNAGKPRTRASDKTTTEKPWRWCDE